MRSSLQSSEQFFVVRFVLLISVGQLPEDAAEFLTRLKLAVLYGEGSLFGYFWVIGAWHLFKAMKR
jgi:hypothetical protein